MSFKMFKAERKRKKWKTYLVRTGAPQPETRSFPGTNPTICSNTDDDGNGGGTSGLGYLVESDHFDTRAFFVSSHLRQHCSRN